MRKKLFVTTALATVSFVAHSALAENIIHRQVIQNGETAVFDNATALSLGSDENGAVIYNRGNVTITNSDFERNYVLDADTSSGGAIDNEGSLEISDSTFKKNESGWGGAISNTDDLKLKDVDFVENKALADDRNFGGNGGAIYNYWTVDIDGGSFNRNTAFDGGAIFNRNKAKVSAAFTDNSAYLGGAVYNESKLNVSNSTFTGNRATEDDSGSGLSSGKGGAIYNEGTLEISDTLFDDNDGYQGGALYSSRKATITNSTFNGNEVDWYGGAIYNESSIDVSENSMTIANSDFSNNRALGNPGSPSIGGAIYDYRGKMTITNSTFTGNEAIGSAASSGGAVATSSTILSRAVIDISDSTFSKNKSAWGGAIENSGETNLTNVDFIENVAEYHTNDGGYGGAIHNGYVATGPLTITDASFTNNSASSTGGAIFNGYIMNLNGDVVFEGNHDSTGLNDIDNRKTINVNGNVTLDGGISGYRGSSNYGTVVFADGSNLTVKAGTTTISKNTVVNNGATLHLNISNDFSGDYELITDYSTLDNEFALADNNLYNIAYTDTKGTYAISKKSSSEVAEAMGISSNEAATIAAITDGNSTNEIFNKIADEINDLIQSGDSQDVKQAIEGANTLAPEVAPIVEQTQTETVKQVFNAVSNRLSSGTSGASEGISSGDVLDDAIVWMQGLANHAKLDKTSESQGYEADTYGVAFGLEKKIDNDTKAGVGYSYNSTDVDSKGRDTKIKTHTLLAYGEYKPSNWFVNGIISHSWSNYKEKKNVIGNIVHADYDVKTFGMQAMTGYDFNTPYATITPEIGLRYLHINVDHYSDSAGQDIASDSSNIITGVVGSKINKTIETKSGLILTPEVRLALTYDLKEADNKSSVLLPNGSSYNISGKTLNRFGVEIGGGLTVEVNNNVEMSLGYEGDFREDYQNHSGLVNVKYKF